MTTNNAANISATGVISYNGTGTFSGSTLTQHYALVAGASNAITSISPSTAGFVYTSNGTSADPSFQAIASSGFTTITGGLTNAQIKALHGTPVQVIAAPASGSFIRLVNISTRMIYGGSNVFTAGAAQTINLYYSTTSNAGQMLANALIIASSNQVSPVGSILNVTGAFSLVDGLAINAYNPVATEITGNAANDNTITYSITYQIITI